MRTVSFWIAGIIAGHLMAATAGPSGPSKSSTRACTHPPASAWHPTARPSCSTRATLTAKAATARRTSHQVRTGPNTWIEPPAVSSPSRLRCTRPQLIVAPSGDFFIVYELRWAYYTGILKYRRTGPTSWVRDGDPYLIACPGTVSCGQDDPNQPNAGYMYGYNPRLALGGDGSLHVLANRTINGTSVCTYAYNSGPTGEAAGSWADDQRQRRRDRGGRGRRCSPRHAQSVTRYAHLREDQP